MKRAIIVGLALTLLPYCSAVAQAQSDPSAQHAPSEAVDVDDVIVNGQSIRRNAESFVSAVAAPPIGRKAATWKDRVCVGAIGFAPEPATAIVDRILDWSHSFGLRVGASGCTPNVFVVATDNGAQTAKDLVRMRPDTFDIGASSSDRGGVALRAFQDSASPVRWWHTSLPTNADTGRPIVRLRNQPPFAPMNLEITRPSDLGDYGRTMMSSRLYDNSEDKIISVVIIVDVSAIHDVNITQLSDYLAMVALAQVAPSTSPAVPSILNLFSAQGEPQATLSPWDRAYLETLYSHSARTVPPSQDRDLVAKLMAQRVQNTQSGSLPDR